MNSEPVRAKETVTMKRMNILPAIACSAALLLTACGSDAADTAEASEETAESTTRLWIKPDLVDCEGSAPQTCMQIAESEDGEYEYFYDQIAGFTFVEGTSYVLDVTIADVENPPADGSSLAYTLVEIIEEN